MLMDKTSNEIKGLMHELGYEPTPIIKGNNQEYTFGIAGSYDERNGILEKIFGPVFDAIEGKRSNPLKRGPLPRHTYIDNIEALLKDTGFEVEHNPVCNTDSYNFFKAKKIYN